MSSFLENTKRFVEAAAKKLSLSRDVTVQLLTPRREVRVELTIPRDDGTIGTFTGYRVQHDDSRGPFKGGSGSIPRWTPTRSRRSRRS